MSLTSLSTTYKCTDDPTKTMHLTSLDGAKKRLLLFKANLLEEGSFDEIVNGCEGVFHTASPCQFSVPARDPQVRLCHQLGWFFNKLFSGMALFVVCYVKFIYTCEKKVYVR